MLRYNFIQMNPIMKKIFWLVVILGVASRGSHAQTLAKDLPLTITDGAGGTQTLRFGLAPAATDGIDAALGESELPPFPPAGVFEARFIGEDISLPQLGQGAYKDYRAGSAAFIGTAVHELRFQTGSGAAITISWDFPRDVTGVLQDIILGTIVKQEMKGKSSYTVTNPNAINKLKMTMTYASTVGITQEKNGAPAQYHLGQNYPNPFGSGAASRPATTIHFALPQLSAAKLGIFDMRGRLVATLVDKTLPAGEYQWRFDLRDLPSGAYIYQLQAGAFRQQNKLTLIK